MGFFVFVTTFCTGFTRTEKYQVKVIDDDIYNRIIEFKAKNEIIKMNRNYSNVDKRIWIYAQTNMFMSIILMTKITLDI